MYVCVFALICRLAHWNHKERNQQAYRNRETILKMVIFVKTFRSKVLA